MRRLATVITVAIVVAAGCGGDDSSSDGDTSSPTETAADTTADTTADTGGGGGASGDYCEVVASVNDEFSAVDDADENDMFDPATFEEMFNKVVVALDAMEEAAPEEIADDFGVLSASYSQVVEVLEAAGWDMMALMSDPEAAAALEALDSAEVATAIANIEDYTLAECGIDLNGDDTGTGDTGSSDTGSSDTMAPTDPEAVDMAADMLQSMLGLTDEQALCLAEKASEAGLDPTDTEAMMGILGECDISLEDLVSGAGG